VKDSDIKVFREVSYSRKEWLKRCITGICFLVDIIS
jgi:hypothetical protein